jgi:hypothetical protein
MENQVVLTKNQTVSQKAVVLETLNVKKDTTLVKHSQENPITKDEIRARRDKDRTIVEGVFRHFETPGATLSFVYRKYLGDNIERYDLTDGHRYSLPLGVAKHLNKSGKYPTYEHIPGTNIQQAVSPRNGIRSNAYLLGSQRIRKMISRFGFQGTDFMDLDNIPDSRQILLVESAF